VQLEQQAKEARDDEVNEDTKHSEQKLTQNPVELGQNGSRR